MVGGAGLTGPPLAPTIARSGPRGEKRAGSARRRDSCLL